jgi:UDP-N-acetyl-2-amino-2-deoxyglucuronate dehydrogenase
VEPIGTALIGLGRIAPAHAEALASLPGSRFVGVFDNDPARVAAFAERYHVRPFTSIDRLLADSDVQMVTICTPHPTHAGLAILAAGAGRHVLVEKPMAVTLADCDAMIDAAAAHGVTLGVMSQRRFYEPVQRVRLAISEGRIGKPILATLVVLGWRGHDYYRSDPWRGTWAGEGGGVLVNQVSHHLDLLQWFIGPVEELFGYWANLNHPYVEVEDTAIAVLRFSNGALGSIVVSNSQKPGLNGRIHVHGETGASIGVQTETGSAFVAGDDGTVPPPVNDVWTIPGEEHLLRRWQREDRDRGAGIDIATHYHRVQIQEFLDAIAGHRAPLVSGQEGRKSVEIAAAIYRSQTDRAPIGFPMGPRADGIRSPAVCLS